MRFFPFYLAAYVIAERVKDGTGCHTLHFFTGDIILYAILTPATEFLLRCISRKKQEKMKKEDNEVKTIDLQVG